MKASQSLKVMLLVAVLAFTACSFYLNPAFKKTYSSVNQLLYSDSVKRIVLKAHCRNGYVYVFNQPWNTTEDRTHLLGEGTVFNERRQLVNSGALNMPVDSIVLFETNAQVKSFDKGIKIALGILTAFDVAGLAFCLINPKACFGSCPTFYLPGDNGIMSARAEGFSSSILPSWEQADLDELHNDELHTRNISLLMKNEALETHAVNYVHLMAVKREPGEQIFHDNKNNFFACNQEHASEYAIAGDSDVTALVNAFDGKEYFSKTDSFDLGKTEEMILNFKRNSFLKHQGLVISFRQTLVTTFLFYSMLGYMGNDAGDILTDLELHPDQRVKAKHIQARLGSINAFVWDDLNQRWMAMDSVFEVGPIARNTVILPIPHNQSTTSNLKIKLVMAKGYWRIDNVSVTQIIGPRRPEELIPQAVLKNGELDEVERASLFSDDEQRTCSLPGTVFELKYQLPEVHDYALFVQSKGYYLEWMRPTWWKEKNLLKLKRMIDGDEKTWRNLAVEYKEHEPQMEATFWGSKVM
ncbi:MAG: hypothetical protein H0W62_13050 [Chitinophagales bacterium]|nr:hypothetical protein [Chitinophagales bacterium]